MENAEIMKHMNPYFLSITASAYNPINRTIFIKHKKLFELLSSFTTKSDSVIF